MYTDTLRKVQNDLGSGVTTNVQLNRYMQLHPLSHLEFLGCYTRDMIPKNMKATQCCICNTDTSRQAGTHWVALIGQRYIYDSYNRTLGGSFKNRKSLGNGVADQSDSLKHQESNCGQRCIAALHVVDTFGINGLNQI